MNDFLKKIVKLSSELNEAEGFQILMIVNDMEKIYNQHVEEIKKQIIPNNIEKKFENSVREYILAFDAKYETDTEEVDFANMYFVADMYLSLNDIRYCVDNDVEFDDLYAWYWFIVETKCRINLNNYLRRKEDYPESDHKDLQIILLNEMIPSNENE